MILLDHRPIQIVLLLSLVLFVAVRLFRAARSKRPLLRLPTQAAAVLVALGSGLLLLADGCTTVWGYTESSEPVYSPDRKHALVIRDYDAGALGGNTWVNVYSFGGLREEGVASGDWKFIQIQDVRWTSNKDLELHFEPLYPAWPPRCEELNDIHITCIPKP